MYHCINEIIGYKLMAMDGEIGKCADFLFEDRPWIIRYMVADTGNFLHRQKVLIPFIELGKPDWSTQMFHIDLTKQQIEESPPLSEDKPVSRQYEKISFLYFGWPSYWAEDELENTASTPSGVFREPKNNQDSDEKESSLRSVKEVAGYHVAATDGKAGKVSDFIVDDNIWTIRYLVLDIQNSVKDKKVLLPPDWVNTVDWLSRVVNVDLSVDGINNCPEFNPAMPFGSDTDSMISWSNWTKAYVGSLERENHLLRLSIKKYKKQIEYYKVKMKTMKEADNE
ncbi:MAG: PRC-barrel domain-containing protein [Desulfobacterales bacterium]|nr:PRC-barrel domain-containing protein [Desulfobacterales bacterium]